MKRKSLEPPAAQGLGAGERAALARLDTPGKIQAYLDGVPYSTDTIYRCPRSVLADRKAHCFDGALLAACALGELGHPPLIVDLRAVRDDDHVIAVFRRRGRWGAIAKSNVVGLRFREPIYATLRELVMSYFELYYNTDGEKTLRSYSRPLDLREFDESDWRVDSSCLEEVVVRLDKAHHEALLTDRMVGELLPVDERSYHAGLLGADEAGLYAADRLRRKSTG